MLRLLPEAQRQQLVFASSGARVASNSDDDDGPSKPRRKRHQTGRACVVCRRAKTACGVERPCERCIRIGQPQFCVSHVPAASNRKRKDKINAGRPIAASPSVDSISVAPPRAPLPPSDSAESFDQSTNSLTSASSVQSSSSNLNVIAQLHSFSSQLINSAHSPLVPLSQSIFVHTSSSSNSLYSPCEQTSVTTLDSVSSIDPLPPAQLVSVPVGSDPAHDSQSLSPGSFKTEVISEEDEEEEEFREATRQKVLARARFWSDSICKVFSSLDSTVRKGHGDTQLLRGMAWIFYQIYSIAPSYRKAIDEAVGAAVRAKFDKPKPVVATSPQKLKPSASASLAPTPSTESVSAEPAASSSSSQVRSPSLSYVPPLSDIRDNPMSVFLTMVSRDNRRLFDSSYAVGTTACVTREVPPIDLPKLALPLQDRMYGMLNSWRFHPEVQTCVSKYLHHQTPFDLKLNMMTEKVRSSMVPFGVLILPLYPAPFAGYRPWCNQSFALMLGYSHSEALEKCQTIPGFRSFFEDESMNLYNTEQYSVVTRGKTASTMPFTVVTKDGCPVKTILSVSWKYQDLLPLYSVCYFQVVAPIGDMIVFNVAKQ